MMFRHKVLLFVIFTLVPFVTSTSILAQDCCDVAILVVDIFDEPDPPESETPDDESDIQEDSKDGNCTYPVDGQDGNEWAGGSGMSASLGYPIPHGRLVYGHLQQLFAVAIGKPEVHISGAALIAELGDNEGLREVDIYRLPDSNKKLYLVAVDSDGYTTQSMTERIEQTLSSLSSEYGIKRFVINMSFGLIPCKDLPVMNASVYATILETIMQAIQREDTDFPPELALGFEEFRQQFIDLQNNSANDPQSLNELLNLMSGLTGDPIHRYVADLISEAYYVIYSRPNFHALMTRLYGDPSDQDNITPATFTADPEDPDGCFSFQVPNDPWNTQQDPLFNLLAQFNTWCNLPDSPQEMVVVPIASAGNVGYEFPFAPAFWPEVLSVSAQYEDLMKSEICPSPATTATGRILENLMQWRGELGMSDDDLALSDNELQSLGYDPDSLGERSGLPVIDIRQEISLYLGSNSTLPPSNKGEIQMNGVYPHFTVDRMGWRNGCRWGTSFAAPRLSFEMALYLTEDPICSHPLVLANMKWDPVFQIMTWDDEPRFDAAEAHCIVFNDFVGPLIGNSRESSVNDLDLRP